MVASIGHERDRVAVGRRGVFENRSRFIGAEDLALGQSQQQRFANGERREPGRSGFAIHGVLLEE